ncbi:hypothetical protein [Brevibacillus gelatini]
MDLIGHLVVIEEAGLTNGKNLKGDEIIYSMFPNIGLCHEWAYKSLWDAHRCTDDQSVRLIQGHMICDYVIHYGPDLTEPKQRIGWAYKEMPKALDVMETFLKEVIERKLAPVNPRELDPDEEHFLRDFGHTAIECALDFALATRFKGGDRLNSVCDAFRKLGRPGVGEKFVEDVFQRTNGYTREPREAWTAAINNYSKWADLAKTPTEFAALTFINKYNLHENKESLDFCVNFLEDLSKQLDPSALDKMLYEIIERIANPEIAIKGRTV